MQLLLIGCTGFIGKELVPKLLKSGHRLTILSRQSKNSFNQNEYSKNISHISIDVSNPISWQNKILINALNESDGVINLAGEPISDKRWTKTYCKKIRESRLSSTEGLIQALSQIKNPPKVLINASAIGFYGASTDKEFTEEMGSGEDFLANLCREWESIASNKTAKTRLLIIRIGIVLASDGGALGKMMPVFNAGFGGPIGDGKQWMSWIHREDLCGIIEQALVKKSWSGIINGVAPNPVSMNEFTATLGSIMGRPNLIPVPGPLLKLILGDGAKIVLEGQKVRSLRLEKLKYKFKFPFLNEALSHATKRVIQ